MPMIAPIPDQLRAEGYRWPHAFGFLKVDVPTPTRHIEAWEQPFGGVIALPKNCLIRRKPGSMLRHCYETLPCETL